MLNPTRSTGVILHIVVALFSQYLFGGAEDMAPIQAQLNGGVGGIVGKNI